MSISTSYAYQKLLTACEFLVSSGDLSSRLLQARSAIGDLRMTGDQSLTSLDSRFEPLLEQLDSIQSLDESDLTSVSDSILQLMITMRDQS